MRQTHWETRVTLRSSKNCNNYDDLYFSEMSVEGFFRVPGFSEISDTGIQSLKTKVYLEMTHSVVIKYFFNV